VPAPLPEEPGAELPGEVEPDEPGGIADGVFSLGLLGAELGVPYDPLPAPDGLLPVPFAPLPLALVPIDPLPVP
jgi:hypothetical protein